MLVFPSPASFSTPAALYAHEGVLSCFKKRQGVIRRRALIFVSLHTSQYVGETYGNQRVQTRNDISRRDWADH